VGGASFDGGSRDWIHDATRVIAETWHSRKRKSSAVVAPKASTWTLDDEHDQMLEVYFEKERRRALRKAVTLLALQVAFFTLSILAAYVIGYSDGHRGHFRLPSIVQPRR